jgi:REP element-mobilizing transposase RayT
MKPRQIIPGRTYLITRRCTQRQFLLRPDDVVAEVIQYCLAEAATRFDVTLHAWVAMSNHLHLVVRDNRGNLPEFLCQLHKLIAKALNTHHDRSEHFWAAGQPSVVYLVEPRDAFDKLVYVITNPVNADLVDRVVHWPGACSLQQNLSAEPKTVRRPRLFFRKHGPLPERATLRAERLAGYEGLTAEEWNRKIMTAVADAEERARRRRHRRGAQVLGRKNVFRTVPTHAPASVEKRGALRPEVACRRGSARSRALRELREFRIAHRAALRRVLDGQRDVVFPRGTYRVLPFRPLLLARPPEPLTPLAS